MSETVGRKGKLILCKKYKDADELEANLQEFWKNIPVEERGRYYKDVEEIGAEFVDVNDIKIIGQDNQPTVNERKSNA